MNQDFLPKFQPAGTYRFALNSVLDSIYSGVIDNELGNTLMYFKDFDELEYPIEAKILGHCLTNTEEIILALKDDTNNYILLVNPNTSTFKTIMISNSCLNFSYEHPINILFKIRNGCERIILLTDSYNVYRIINIDAALELGGYTESHCNIIKYSREYAHNTFTVDTSIVLDDGGQLEYGSYAFALRYLDSEQNPTSE